MPGTKAVLGTSDPAQIHSSCGAAPRNSETIRMAHVPAHLLDSAPKCRNRVQGDAGAPAAFNSAIHVGRLHSGGHSGEACSASGGRVIGLFFRRELWITFGTAGCRSRIAAKKTQKGREMRPFRALDGFERTVLTLLERMAGTTRLELATSAVTVTLWTQRNQSVTCAVVGNRWVHWAQSPAFCSTICSTPPLPSEPRRKVQLRCHLCRET